MKWLALILILTACAPAEYSDIGHEYLGAAYVADPLGEGILPDADPLIRNDAFDCTTFVETALAGGDIETLNKIRYKNDKIGFLTRNHFIETDWLENNANRVSVVTKQYGDVATRNVVIDRKNWLRTVHGIDAEYPTRTVMLEYIPYDKLEKLNPVRPLIVLFIADKSQISDKIGTDLAVRHMGFLLPGGVLRHASQEYGRVMDTDFYEYAMRRANGTHDIGIMLVEIK